MEGTKIGDHSYRFRSIAKAADSSTDFRFEFTTNGFPRFRARSEAKGKVTSASDAKDVKTNTRATFRMGITRVIEFVDTAPLGEYNGESVVSSVQFTKRGAKDKWSTLTVTDATVGTVKTTTLKTTFTQNSTTVDLSVAMASAGITLATGSLTPAGVKWGLAVNKYPSTRTDTLLGVVTKVQAKSKVKEVDLSRAEGQIDIVDDASGSREGKLKFEKMAKAKNGTDTSVKASKILPDKDPEDQAEESNDDDDRDNDEQSSRVVFVVNSVNKDGFFWDPEIMLDTPVAVPNSAGSVASSVIFAVLAVVALLF